MVYAIQAFLWFAFLKKICAKNLEIQNDRHFWQVKYKHLCFAIFAKNWKIQNGCQFWRVKYLLKLGKASLHRYPVDKIFCRNRSILHGFRDTSIFVFCDFCEKFENSKWLPFLSGQNFFENWVTYSARVALWVKCYVEIALSSTVFKIQGFLKKN